MICSSAASVNEIDATGKEEEKSQASGQQIKERDTTLRTEKRAEARLRMERQETENKK